MSAAERHVRVTLEGTARPVDSRSDRVLRVTVPQATGTYTVTLDAGAAGVTVEDVPAPRTWTSGDVVGGDCTVYQRQPDGTWRGLSAGHIATATDADMTDAVDVAKHGAGNAMLVLRYQAGGDQ